MPLDDPAIRAALTHRAARETPTAHIRHELGLNNGAARADVAVLTPTDLTGYEIKSDRDTLDRFPAQVSLYSEVFDHAYLVAPDRQLDAAARLLPPWWGVIRALPDGSLNDARPARRNPHPEPMALARLLWRDEVLSELRELGAATGLSKARRWHLWKRLIETVPRDELRRIVVRRITGRTETAA